MNARLPISLPARATLREMTEADIETQSRLKRQVFADMYAGHVSDERIDQYLRISSYPDALRTKLAEPERRLVTAEVDGQIVGGAIAKIDGHIGYLSAVWVDEAWRGQGIGLALANWREQVCRDEGCTVLQLHVWRENTGGVAFARSRGYVWTGKTLYDKVTDSQLDLYERAA
jgi:GNAT superfamily N-acetyltransferase